MTFAQKRRLLGPFIESNQRLQLIIQKDDIIATRLPSMSPIHPKIPNPTKIKIIASSYIPIPINRIGITHFILWTLTWPSSSTVKALTIRSLIPFIPLRGCSLFSELGFRGWFKSAILLYQLLLWIKSSIYSHHLRLIKKLSFQSPSQYSMSEIPALQLITSRARSTSSLTIFSILVPLYMARLRANKSFVGGY